MSALRICYYSVLIIATSMVISAIANAQPAVVTGQNLNVIVDVDACLQGFDFCTDSGSSGPAADGNNSVVSVVIQVTRNNGTPVSGLLETNFSISSITNSGPGVSPVFVPLASCVSCFMEPEPGVYRLAARPSFGNWGDGTYVALIEVASGAVARQTIIPIDIPN